MKGGLCLILEGIENAKRMLSVFSLREVVKLMLLQLLKDVSYTYYPVVNHLLFECVPGSGFV